MALPITNAGDKARKTKEELNQFRNYASAMDKDGTITSYNQNKRKSNYLATGQSNPLVRGTQRLLRMTELARIARKRK